MNDFDFKRVLLRKKEFIAKIISLICKMDYSLVVQGNFIDPNLPGSNSTQVPRIGDLVYKIDENTYVDIEAYRYYNKITNLKTFDYTNRMTSTYGIKIDKKGRKIYNKDIKIYSISIYENSPKYMSFFSHDSTYGRDFNKFQFVETYHICLDKMKNNGYTESERELCDYLYPFVPKTLEDMENILKTNHVVKENEILKGVYEDMVMFYKPDGSWDREAYNKYRLEEEYQIGYGSGEEAGEERGEKRGIAIGEERGRVLERESNIRMLSQSGISNEAISLCLNISLEEIEKILNQKDHSLNRKIN